MALIKPITTKEKLTTASIFLGVVIALMTLGSSVVNAIDFVNSLAKKTEVDAKLEYYSKQTNQNMMDMERRSLKRKLFELNLIKTPTQSDTALIKQYQQDLDELNKAGVLK